MLLHLVFLQKNLSLLKRRSLTFHIGKHKVGPWGGMRFSAGSKPRTVPGEWCLSNTIVLSDSGALPTLIPPFPNTSTGKETSVNPLALLQCFTAVITTDTKRRMFSSPKFLRYFSKQTQVYGAWLHEKYPTRGRGVGKDDEEPWSADNWAQHGFRFTFSDYSIYLSKSKLLILKSKQYSSGNLHSLLATSDEKHFREKA